MTLPAFHPFAILAFIWTFLIAYIVVRTKADLPAFVKAVNTIGEQPTAIIVIIIGCVMLVLCKEFGLDSTIAGGIIGIGGNMLQNKLKATEDAQPQPPAGS